MIFNKFSRYNLIILSAIIFSLWTCSSKPAMEVMKWHNLELSFKGPQLSEEAGDNPFLNYRLEVTFKHDKRVYVVPGFYDADGNPAETGTNKGNVWKVRFCPDALGSWAYSVSFRKGKDIAISDDIKAGKPVYFDGANGQFNVIPSDKQDQDLRGKGRLLYVGERYLRFAETGEWFLKGGADSPENFLAYQDFDGTYFGGQSEQRQGEAATNNHLHTYAPHASDWHDGDPTWQNGKGKNIIGALNYLSSKGMNAVYFLTMNIGGDGKDVWPYTGYDERYRFDCSKLDQWEIVFDHMEKLGLMLHIVTQETENEMLLDSGNTGVQRKLYYRQLIARFSHHLAITWNMGEENGPADFTPNGQSIAQQKAMVRYMKTHDPYQNFVVIHTHSNPKYRYAIFDQLLGFKYLDGPSIQVGTIRDAHSETRVWTKRSAGAEHPWVVNIDEIGPASRGVDPDDRQDNNQDTIRAAVLWGNLMAGGGGVEWYFGYKNHDNDLSCENWRSRDHMWDYTRHALDFFHHELPFWDMENADQLVDSTRAYCLAQKGLIYAIYLPLGGSTSLDLNGSSASFEIKWYNPRSGGNLLVSTVPKVTGGKKVDIGQPPANPNLDWAVLVKKE